MQEFPVSQSELSVQRCCRSNDTVTAADGVAAERSEERRPGKKERQGRTERHTEGKTVVMTNLVDDLLPNAPSRVFPSKLLTDTQTTQAHCIDDMTKQKGHLFRKKKRKELLIARFLFVSYSHAASDLYYEELFLSTYLLPSLSLSSTYLPSLFLLPVFHLSFTVRLITFCPPPLPPSLPTGSLLHCLYLLHWPLPLNWGWTVRNSL